MKRDQAGFSATELCRKYGISDATFYIHVRLSRCKPILNSLYGQLQTSIRCHRLARGAKMGNPLAHASITGRPRGPL